MKRKQDILSRIIPFDTQDKLKQKHMVTMYLFSHDNRTACVTIWNPRTLMFVDYIVPIATLPKMVELSEMNYCPHIRLTIWGLANGVVSQIDSFSGHDIEPLGYVMEN